MEIKIKEVGQDYLKNKLSKLGGNLTRFWMRHFMVFFFLVLIGFICWGGYIWRQSTGNSVWSDEKKLEYFNAQSKGVTLNEKQYQDVLTMIKAREEENVRGVGEIRNLFEAY